MEERDFGYLWALFYHRGVGIVVVGVGAVGIVVVVVVVVVVVCVGVVVVIVVIVVFVVVVVGIGAIGVVDVSWLLSSLLLLSSSWSLSFGFPVGQNHEFVVR